MPAIPCLILACLVLASMVGPALAETSSLVRHGSFIKERGSLLDNDARIRKSTQSASLFAGQRGQSFFAPVPPRIAAFSPVSVPPQLRGTQIERLRQIIEYAESRRDGYDAVQHGARIKPPKRPTQMTLAEVNRWIDDTPGQPHAIGRYQFIPATLRRLVKMLDVPQTARFSPAVQDLLADQLLKEAGLHRMLAGDMTRHGFMNNLAKIWAGFPTSNGQSYYHGFAGNKASITWARFDAYMADIFSG